MWYRVGDACTLLRRTRVEGKLEARARLPALRPEARWAASRAPLTCAWQSPVCACASKLRKRKEHAGVPEPAVSCQSQLSGGAWR